jgi:hypothetical protein
MEDVSDEPIEIENVEQQPPQKKVKREPGELMKLNMQDPGQLLS